MNKQATRACSIKVLSAVLFALLLLLFNLGAEKLQADNLTQIHILPHGIGVPIGKILLVKSDSEICAIRFTSTDRGHDKREPSIWTSGEESEYAEYDWYCLEGEALNFSEGTTKKGHKQLSFKAPKGIGRLAFQTGNPYLKFGAFKLFWSYPTYVYFPEYGGKQKEGTKVLFAPTAYQKIETIDLNQNHTWYGYEETRGRYFINLESLKK